MHNQPDRICSNPLLNGNSVQMKRIHSDQVQRAWHWSYNQLLKCFLLCAFLVNELFNFFWRFKDLPRKRRTCRY
jgi:hypothetical protein